MDNSPFCVLFSLVINYLTDLANSESCVGQFINSSTSQYRRIYLYCTTGCCGKYINQFCCSAVQSQNNSLSGGDIFGISFGVIAGTIIFFGLCICVYKLCIMPTIRRNRHNNSPENPELQNRDQSGDIAMISIPDTLPKYEDLPPSYEEAVRGTVNLSYLEDLPYIPENNQQQSTQEGVS